jgi:hypothetical protein
MPTKFKPRTVLVIPDSHAQPGDSLERFGKMMAFLDQRNAPLDRIVHIGDLWDFSSLCTHDMDDPTWTQRSLQLDIKAGFDALDWIISIAHAHGQIPIDIIEGNHEDRYNKWMASDNRLLTSDFPKTVKQLVAERRKTLPIRYHNFLKPVTIYGAVFQHYFVSGVMGRPRSRRPATPKGEGSKPSTFQPNARRAKSSPKPKPQPISSIAVPAGSPSLAMAEVMLRSPAFCCT